MLRGTGNELNFKAMMFLLIQSFIYFYVLTGTYLFLYVPAFVGLKRFFRNQGKVTMLNLAHVLVKSVKFIL